jgi:hypothetical protein
MSPLTHSRILLGHIGAVVGLFLGSLSFLSDILKHFEISPHRLLILPPLHSSFIVEIE